MDAVPVCFGKKGIGHLKQFFPFLLVERLVVLQGIVGNDNRVRDDATVNLY